MSRVIVFLCDVTCNPLQGLYAEHVGAPGHRDLPDHVLPPPPRAALPQTPQTQSTTCPYKEVTELGGRDRLDNIIAEILIKLWSDREVHSCFKENTLTVTDD